MRSLVKSCVAPLIVLMVLAGCRTFEMGPPKFDEVSGAELSSIRDSFYVLKMVPSHDDPSQYRFVTCHLDKHHHEVVGSCVNAFMTSMGEEITFSKATMDALSAAYLDPNKSSENKTPANALEQSLKATSILGHVAGATTGALAVGGVVIAAKGLALAGAALGTIMMGVTVVGLGSGGVLYFVNSDHSRFLGYHRERLASSMQKMSKDVGTFTAEKTAEVANNLAIQLSKQVLAANEIDTAVEANSKPEFKVVVWGSAARTVAKEWEHISSSSAIVPHPVSAKIPDILPLLAGTIEEAGLVVKGQITHHCLPRKAQRYNIVPACILIKDNWHTGGFAKYIKPTHTE